MKLKTIQNNIIIIIFSLFFLESCKNLPGADARKVSYDPKKRVQKNIEEGKESLRILDKLYVANQMNNQ